uniref:RRM domain-containing protein n=1 Tax=Amphiprion percula TaxID=161767 RepID=A0A3P8TAQ9_AMPPE
MESRESRRTVVVSGVPAALPAGRMADKLMIHFQSRRRSDGGDVEEVEYPTNMDGVAFVTFDRAEDAARVTRKEQQIMMDSEFPQEYVLTVFPFSRDVFVYVASATVDLSKFGSDPAPLIKSLQSAHRSLRFQPLLPGKVSIEGPFSAVQALRADLIRRDSQLKSPNSAIKLTETPVNPRLISHHRPVGSVSRDASKAMREPASSSSLSTSLQSTGEVSEVQSLLSKAKTPNASSRRKVSDGSLAGGRCLDADGEESRGRPRSNMSTEYRREGTKANARQVVGAEIDAGIISALSSLDLLPAEQKSANKPQQHLRAHGISESKAGGQDHLGSAAKAKSFQNTFKDVSTPSKSRAGLSDVHPEPPEDILVDSDTFRYVEKFSKKELDGCLNGIKMSVTCFKESGLTRISLTRNLTNTAASSIQKASERLKTLMDFWLSTLRVHEIIYDSAKLPDEEKVTQICNDVNSLYKDVLYVFEGSFIKVIGPSWSSYLFLRRVEETLRRSNK